MSIEESIGVDIGGTNIRVARISQQGDILDFRSEKVSRERDQLLEEIQEHVGKMLTDETKGIGIGIAGRVFVPEGRVLTAGFLDLQDVPLGEMINKRFGLTVVVDNDAYMAAFAEWKAGAAIGNDNVVMFTIGTGIGGAVLLDGRLFYGKGAAGQLGHLTVLQNGAICNCGRHGCVETLSSGTVLRSYIRESSFPENTMIEDLLKLKHDGNAEAIEILKKWIVPMRMAIDSAVAAFDPDVVILGGGLGKAAYNALQDFPAESAWFQCPIHPAKLDDNAGVIGSGLRIFE